MSVSALDETWVRGRADELRDLLRKAHSRFGFHPMTAGFVPFGLCAFIFLGIVIALLSGLFPSGKVLLLLYLGGAAISIVTWLTLRRQSITTLTLTPGKRTPWTHSDWIGLAVLAVALVTLAVIAVQTWGS